MYCSFFTSDYISGGQDVWIEQADEVTHSMNAQSVLIAAGNKWQAWVVIRVLLLAMIELGDSWRHRTFKAVPPWAGPASAWGPLLEQQWNQYGLEALTWACNYLHGIKAACVVTDSACFQTWRALTQSVKGGYCPFFIFLIAANKETIDITWLFLQGQISISCSHLIICLMVCICDEKRQVFLCRLIHGRQHCVSGQC